MIFNFALISRQFSFLLHVTDRNIALVATTCVKHHSKCGLIIYVTTSEIPT